MSQHKTLSATVRKCAGKASTFTATITTDSIDRDGEVVIPAGMNSKEYERNPVLLYEHDQLKPIGKMLKMRRNEKSIEAEFALAPRPEGHTGDWLPDTIGALMEFGALNAMSIGFMGTEARPATKADTDKFGSGVRRVYSKWKLFEVSVVSVPANQDAIITAVRKGLVTADAATRLGVDSVRIKNCGTGSEGFEPGNTCATGGGGGSGSSGNGGAAKPSASKPKMPEKPPTPPKAGSAGEQWGKPPAEGLEPPAKPHKIPLPKDPSRLNIDDVENALNEMGYERTGRRFADRDTISTIRDASGNEREVSGRDLRQLIYGNSASATYRDIRVPVKRPRKDFEYDAEDGVIVPDAPAAVQVARKHVIRVEIPAMAVEDRTRVVREEIARARGRIYAD